MRLGSAAKVSWDGAGGGEGGSAADVSLLPAVLAAAPSTCAIPLPSLLLASPDGVGPSGVHLLPVAVLLLPTGQWEVELEGPDIQVLRPMRPVALVPHCAPSQLLKKSNSSASAKVLTLFAHWRDEDMANLHKLTCVDADPG